MEKLTARSYIEKRVENTRTPESDGHSTGTIRNSPGWSLEDLAVESASLGEPEVTASFLSLDNSLPVNLKGEIMAEAFKLQADRYDYMVKSFQDRAAQSKKIAQGLTRAATRIHKS